MKDNPLLAKPRIDAAFNLLSTTGIEGLRLPPAEVTDGEMYLVDVAVHYCAIGHIEHLADKGTLTQGRARYAAEHFRERYRCNVRDRRSLREPLTAHELVGMLRGCEMHTGTALGYPLFAKLWMNADACLVPSIAAAFLNTRSKGIGKLHEK